MANSPTLPRRHGALGGGALTSGLTGDKRSQELLYALHAKTEVRHAIEEFIEPEHHRWEQRHNELMEKYSTAINTFSRVLSLRYENLRKENQRENATTILMVKTNLEAHDAYYDKTLAILHQELIARINLLERRTFFGLCAWIGRTIKGWFK